jgi:hypothetical protein
MATLLINTIRIPQSVGVVEADGKQAYVRIMARGRGHLAEGVNVDRNWLALNGSVIRVVEEKTVEVAAPGAEAEAASKATVVTSTPAKAEAAAPAATVSKGS